MKTFESIGTFNDATDRSYVVSNDRSSDNSAIRNNVPHSTKNYFEKQFSQGGASQLSPSENIVIKEYIEEHEAEQSGIGMGQEQNPVTPRIRHEPKRRNKIE